MNIVDAVLVGEIQSDQRRLSMLARPPSLRTRARCGNRSKYARAILGYIEGSQTGTKIYIETHTRNARVA